jgi:hypothetical protein
MAAETDRWLEAGRLGSVVRQSLSRCRQVQRDNLSMIDFHDFEGMGGREFSGNAPYPGEGDSVLPLACDKFGIGATHARTNGPPVRSRKPFLAAARPDAIDETG